MKFLKWFAILGLVGCWLGYIVTMVLHVWFRKPFDYTYSDIEFTLIVLGFGFFAPLLVFAKLRSKEW